MLAGLLLCISVCGSAAWAHGAFYSWLVPGSDKTVNVATQAWLATASRVVFAATIAMAVLVMELVLCEIGDWGSPATRLYAWKLGVTAMLALLVFAVPFLMLTCWVFVRKPSRFTAAVTVALFVIYAVSLDRLGAFLPLHNDLSLANETRPQTRAEDYLSMIGLIGVTVMALLSGFGAVSAPYTVFISQPRTVFPDDIERLERSVKTTAELLETKRESLKSVQRRLRERTSMSRSTTNLMLKVMTSLRGGDDLAQEKAALQAELTGLEHMHAALDADLHHLRTTYSFQIQQETPLGQLMVHLYRFFAVYCVYRLVMVLIVNTILRHYDSATGTDHSFDALTHTLAKLIVRFHPDSSVDAWTRQIGFTMSSGLFIASISSVLSTFSNLTKAFPWLATHSTGAMTRHVSALSVAHAMGVYVIATSLLLRSNLPDEMSSAISTALGTPLDVRFIQWWFDTVFGIVAIIATVGLFVAHRYRDQDAFYDEEALIGKMD